MKLITALLEGNWMFYWKLIEVRGIKTRQDEEEQRACLTK